MLKNDNTKRISNTALRNAVLRAVEFHRSKNERLFEDPFAEGLLNFRYKIILELLLLPQIGTAILAKRERRYPGMIGNLLCRTRYIDDILSDALNTSLDQVVILGAGFDTRPYRIPGIDEIHVYEIDHPATQALKMKRVEKMLGVLPKHVTFAAIDFDRQELEEVMAELGFCARAKTLFIWEGVSQYIKTETVDAAFRYLSHTVSPESRIIFTYIDRRIIEGSVNFEHSRNLMVHHERLGEPWVFGISPDEIASYLDARGFRLIDQVGASQYRKHYLLPIDRKMKIFAGEFTAHFKIKDTEKKD